MSLPTNLKIIGVGGCGKTLLKKICEHDWFLKEYLTDNRNLGLYTVDTATNEKGDDTRYMESLRLRIQDMGERAHGVISCGHYHLPDFAQVTRIQDLIAEDATYNLKEDSDDVWWLEDPDHGITFESLCKIDRRLKEGFDGGVYRMRAVSKAAFIKATTLSHADFDPLFSGTGPVAIIVGLGGGTGSGMFIDLARKIHALNRSRPIWLFGVLPASTEGEDERLNAAIALTELEYLQMQDNPEEVVYHGDSLFHHILISSLDPTGFSTIEASKQMEAVQDFSAAFPYQFINAFMNDKDQAITSTLLSYGSFINLDSYAIEYPVDILRSLKTKYAVYLQKLSASTMQRKEIVDTAVKFFEEMEKKYPSSYNAEVNAAYSPNYEEVMQYKSEINAVRAIWEADIARMLRLEPPEKIAGILRTSLDENLSNFESLNRFDEFHEYVIQLSEALGILPTDGWSELGRSLLNCIQENLLILRTIGNYYKETSRLLSPLLQNTYMEVMCVNSNATRTQNEIGRIVTDLKAKTHTRDTELTGLLSTKKGLDAAVEEQKKSILEVISNRNTDITAYCEHETTRDAWENFEAAYMEGILQKCTACVEFLNKSKTGPIPEPIKSDKKYIRFPFLSQEIYPNSEYKSESGVITLLQNLDRDISDYYYWQYMSVVAMREKGSLFKKKLPKDKIRANLDEAFNHLKATCNNLNEYTGAVKGFVYTNEEIVVNLVEEAKPVLSVFEKTRDEFIENILSPVCTSLDLVNEVSRVKDALLDLPADSVSVLTGLTDVLFTLLDGENKWTAELRDTEASIAKLEQENQRDLDTAASLNEVYEKLLKDTAKLRQAYKDGLPEVEAAVVTTDTLLNRNIDRTYRSIAGDMNPEVLSLLDSDDETSSLASLDKESAGNAGKEELRNLEGILRNRYGQLISAPMLGANALVCPSNRNYTKVWRFAAAALVIGSNSLTFTTDFRDTSELGAMRDNINGLLQPRNNNDVHIIVHEKAKPWECSITFMAVGNYLENIIGFERGGFLRIPYEKSNKNVLHHVLLMKKGEFIVRDLLEREESLDLAQMEIRDPNFVKDNILGLYQKHQVRTALSSVPGYGGY